LFSRLFVEGWIATSLAWGTGGTVEEVDRGCIVQKAIRIRAIHPHWNSILRLSIIDGSVVHEEHGGKGKYDLANGVLTIYWERFEPDTFRELSGNYVHELILGNAPKLEQPSAVIVGDKVIAVSRIHVTVPNERYEVSLRLQTSDVPTFFQVFVASEYQKAGFQNVDILKVDIAEGAELELFSHDAAEWLPRIALIIVETHDRFRPGTEEAVRRSLHPMFEELPRSGENLFFRRRQA
jgi:hypothetical protein